MKKRVLTVLAVAGLVGVSVGVGSTASAEPPECNWGKLTSGAIADGFPQGPHSADLSGDGHGPGTVDEPRAGLGNVVSQGDLEATCELIGSLLP
jgi:hypothetical protein